MPDKRNEIMTALNYINDMMIALGYDVDISYHVEDYEHRDEVPEGWKHMHQMTAGDEYMLVRNAGQLLYAVDVTADNTLTAVSELMELLARKCG